MTFGEGNKVAEAIGRIIGRLQQLEMYGDGIGVAEYLQSKGFVGELEACQGCPVWLYLTEGLYWYDAIKEVMAGQSTTTIYFREGGVFCFDTPPKVRAFMQAYDDGEYPELVKAA